MRGASLSRLTRAELEDRAREIGIDRPEKYITKRALRYALEKRYNER